MATRLIDKKFEQDRYSAAIALRAGTALGLESRPHMTPRIAGAVRAKQGAADNGSSVETIVEKARQCKKYAASGETPALPGSPR